MSKLKNYAQVVVELPIFKAFDYKVPDALQEKVFVGSRIWIPFGPRTVTGYIVGFSEKASFSRVKEIEGEVENYPLLDERIIKLAYFIADYYASPIGLVFKCILPKAVRQITRREKSICFVENLLSRQELKNELVKFTKKSFKQIAVIERLQIYKKLAVIPAKDLFDDGKEDLTVLKSLEKKAIIKLKKVVDSDYYEEDDDIYIKTKPLTLTSEQQEAMVVLKQEADTEDFSSVLLYGVTGSGKTEIYLQIIEHILKKGKQAIVIVPEISLTPQTIERFKSRFSGQVAVLHSRLSDGERYYNWRKIKTGEATIAVGPRSAIFAPFANLGVIVVDEEHERSYKQEESPKYNARDIAVVRAKYEKALCVLGSATPCLESYYNALHFQKYRLVKLTKRIDNCLMPTIITVDMKEEIKRNPKVGLFSKRLLDDIYDRLGKGEQTILFLNRRGFSRVMMCQECGVPVECKHCSISLTYHKQIHRLICHTCGYTRQIPVFCPECKSQALKFSGFGTQKIELQLSKIFSTAKIGRMDADTTSKKGSHQRILDNFKTGKIDVLIGTQMIAKGLDFPNVTLVGVISADATLHIPDFRSAENTFQLLTQVSGRAGRGDIHGEVIVQTFNPEHMAICAALEGDYEKFYNQELNFRKELNYPPLARCINLTFVGEDEDEVKALAEKFSKNLNFSVGKLIKLGPVPAQIYRVKNKFRWQILLKGKSRASMEEALQHALQNIDKKDHSKIIIDVDPQGGM